MPATTTASLGTTDLFVGQLKSTLTCQKCRNASVTFDPFWDLSLPIPKSSVFYPDHFAFSCEQHSLPIKCIIVMVKSNRVFHNTSILHRHKKILVSVTSFQKILKKIPVIFSQTRHLHALVVSSLQVRHVGSS